MMNSEWVVIAETDADDGVVGRRIWSERFRTEAAAGLALAFIKTIAGCRGTIIEDRFQAATVTGL
jgi:hypothetical protein